MSTQNYTPTHTIGRILCCECGTTIEPNPANMCVGCLRSHVDITQNIPKQLTIYFCRGCERYLKPPSEWIYCSLQSKELLDLCVKRMKGLDKVKLVDSHFLWTEPHSRRLKVQLTVHGEALGATLEQVFVIEVTVNHQMCEGCHRSEAQNFYRAIVQIRQKCENRKTIYYLEQLILKYKVHGDATAVKKVHEGIDFFYATESNARKMVDFLCSNLPCKNQHSKKLISHDIHSNVYNYKFTYSVEIIPLSKDSVVCLPKKLSQQLGGISQICLVSHISSTVILMDPCTAQMAEVNSNLYWRTPFKTICNPKQLVEFTVMDIDPIKEKDKKYFPGQGAVSSKHVPADVWLVKTSELGINDEYTHSRTHLGHILKVGDSVLGYNLKDSNVNDANYDKLDHSSTPDIILVKKYYPDRAIRKKQRMWKLKHVTLNQENPFEGDEKEYNEFLDELEEDPLLRQNINIYKDVTKPVPVDSGDIDPNMPQISLSEMLEDLVIDDVEMETE